MKVKLSISLDNETLAKIEKHVDSQRFRNKSHAIEFAIRKLLEQENENGAEAAASAKNKGREAEA